MKLLRLEGPIPELPQPSYYYEVKDPNILGKLSEGKAVWVPAESLPECHTLLDGCLYLLSAPLLKITMDSSGLVDKWLSGWVPANILQHLLGGIDRWRDSNGKLWNHGEYPIEFEVGGRSYRLIMKVKPPNLRKEGGPITEVVVGSGHTWGHLKNYYQHTPFIESLEPAVPTVSVERRFLSYCRDLQELDLFLPNSPSANSFGREMIQSKAPKAFWNLEGIPTQVLKWAKAGFGIGRFEDIVEGTIYKPAGGSLLDVDIQSAFPYKLSTLQHPGPNYTKWEAYGKLEPLWKDLSWLSDERVAYVFCIVVEDTGDCKVSPLRWRKQAIEGSIVYFPKGKGPNPITLGRHQLLARLKRYGSSWKEHLTIQGGWVGWVKSPYKPWSKPMEAFWLTRQKAKDIGKFIDTRIVGNLVGTFLDLVDDMEEDPDSILGTYIRKALPTFSPVYAFDVIDWILGTLDSINLQVPEMKLLNNSVDGVAILGPLPEIDILPKEGPGSLKVTELEYWRGYNDHFTGSNINDKWANSIMGNCLAINLSSKPSLVKFLGRRGDPQQLLEMYMRAYEEYQKEPPKSRFIKVRMGTSKRVSKNDPDFDFLRDNRVTECPGISELDAMLLSTTSSDEEGQEFLDESGENGERLLGAS